MTTIQYINSLGDRFEQRSLREKLLILLLVWAFLYGLFYILFFYSLEQKQKDLVEEIKIISNQVDNWNLQISVLTKLANTPQYKQWLAQQRSFTNLQDQYKNFLQAAPNKQWQNIITAVLHNYPNINLIQVKNLPESLYNPTTENVLNSKIYQQKLQVVFNSNFNDTINYIQGLEQLLPYIHWENLNYQVMEYPLAKIDMELAIIYEKKNH